jgi:hypothetical protein
MAGRAEEGWATKPLNSWNEEPRSDSDAMEDVTAAAAAIVCAPAVLQSYHPSVKSSASAPARNAMQLQPALALGAESVGASPSSPALARRTLPYPALPPCALWGWGSPGSSSRSNRRSRAREHGDWERTSQWNGWRTRIANANFTWRYVVEILRKI